MNEEQEKLSPKEAYDLKKENKNQEKQKERERSKIKEAPRKIVKYVLYGLATIVVIVGIGWLFSLIPNMPPTSSQNHSEDSPIAHIITTTMSDALQRHMLEHSDGNGIPGIIIQYNCEDYNCGGDLLDKLSGIVEAYPENVYLAPNRYDGKIILTKIGGSLTLENFDQQKIKNFIEK